MADSPVFMSAVERGRRCKEDFEFMVLCAAKGNMAMYELLRDRSLDEPEVAPENDVEHNG